MHFLKQPEQRLRQDRELAVVGRALQFRSGLFQLLLQLGADEEPLVDPGPAARRDGLRRTDDPQQVVLVLHLQRVTVGLARLRDDGRDEVVLQRRDPAAGHGLGELLVFLVVHVQLAVLLAVVHGRSAESIAFDIEHRSFDRHPVAQQLRIGRQRHGLGGRVDDVVTDIDRITASAQDKRLGDRQALPVGPAERNAQLLLARLQAIFVPCRGELRLVVGLRTAGLAGGQPGLVDEKRIRAVGVEKPDLEVGIVLLERIIEQVRAHDVAAGERDVHVEHIRHHMDHRAGRELAACGHGAFGRRCRRTPRRGRVDRRQRLGKRRRGAIAGRRGRRCRRRCRGRAGRSRPAIVLHPGIAVQPDEEQQADPEEYARVIHVGSLVSAFARAALQVPGRSRLRARGGSGRCASQRARTRGPRHAARSTRGHSSSRSGGSGSSARAAG